jgi:hypothetical protein
MGVTRRRRADAFKNQIAIRISDQQLATLRKFMEYRKMSTPADALRRAIDLMEPWIIQEEARLKQIAVAPVANRATLDDASDDGMAMPSFRQVPEKPAMTSSAAAEELDEDGETLSANEKIRRGMSKPAMEPEVERWPSLKEEP